MRIDYNCKVFFKDGKPSITFHSIALDKMLKFKKHLDSAYHLQWNFFNIYVKHKRGGGYYATVYQDNFLQHIKDNNIVYRTHTNIIDI